ncbi:hypothetical protein LP419_29930 [Massilia sp. H-1]|nr:hypothetical protein LP419_29930 [Massilia sp. H-1]
MGRRDNQRWAFGFRYFKEIKFFGLLSEKIEKKWSISFLNRLGELSALTLESVLESRVVVEGTLRMHNINWDQKSIPIKRTDIDWIGDDYLKNPEEFELFQISVSKAEGRFVGFLDEDNVFQVVLLDPLHNAQPSSYNDYKVQLCMPLGCEMTAIKEEATTALKRIAGRSCSCEHELQGAFTWRKRQPGQAFVIPFIDGTGVEDADNLIDQGKAESYRAIFEAGLVALA